MHAIIRLLHKRHLSSSRPRPHPHPHPLPSSAPRAFSPLASPRPRPGLPALAACPPTPIRLTLHRPSILQPFQRWFASAPPMHLAPLNSALPKPTGSEDGFIDIPSTDGNPAYKLFSRPIITSASDSRTYRVIRLHNDLEAILIHDPKADKAAASMDVNVGHLSDPEQLQGLAHFCEHLLFMGTEKYPSENDYSEYLAKNSGHSNAYTGMDDTVYYFDVHPSALAGALDRFSQFFISPLFSDSCTEREIRAVDSENSKNLQTDIWRMFQLDKATSSRSHAYWRFGTGNLQTLWERPKALGLDVREELLKFHSKHYSSNVMKLAVLGKESLDDLTKLVVEKFSGIPNKQIVPDRFDGSPYSDHQLGKVIFTQMVKDTNLLEITFALPEQSHFYESQPVNFVSHHIGHEGSGSITSYLKKQGWINSLQAGAGGGATGFELFKINVDLTSDGLANYKEIIRVIFVYLDLLRSTPPREWAFKEEALLSDIKFRFKSPSSPSSYVTSLASWMRRPCPKEHVISSIYLANKFDEKLIKETIDIFRPLNSRIIIGSQALLPGIEYDQTEEWYGTKYTIQDFPKEILEKDPPIESLALPPPNSFISTDFHVDKRDDIITPTKRPNCLSDTPDGRIWYKKDDRWWLPRATVILALRNPIINSTCLNTLKTLFITRLLKESLNEQLYEAELAGLSYGVGPSWDSIVFNVDGYNQKLHLLMETVLKALKDLKVDRQKFRLVKDDVERKWKNFVLEGPYAHASYWMEALLSHVHYSYEEKLQVLNQVTPESIEAFIPEVLSRGFVEGLVHGNLTETAATAISNLPKAVFDLGHVKKEELRDVLSLCIPQGSNFAYERSLDNSSNVNSAVDYFIHLGDVAKDDIRTRLSLLGHLMHEPCFNQLRTQEQLGYIVQCYTKQSPGHCGLSFSIQSERDPKYVEGRIENFLNWFLSGRLETMSDEEFEEMKTSLINKALEDFRNMWDESSHYWMHIDSGYYAFDQRYKDAELLKKITKDEMIEFYQHWIHPSSPHRAKCSIRIRSQHVPIPPSLLLKASLAQAVPVEMTTEDTQFLQSKPDLPKVESYMENKPERKELLELIKLELKEEDSIVQPFLSIKPTPVENFQGFKSELKPGPAARPVDDWKSVNA